MGAVDESLGADRMLTAFGEVVTIWPTGRDSGLGDEYAVTGVIDRQAAQSIYGETTGYAYLVALKNDAADGVDVEQLDVQKYELKFAARPGMTPGFHRIARIETVDEGMITLRCH